MHIPVQQIFFKRKEQVYSLQKYAIKKSASRPYMSYNLGETLVPHAQNTFQNQLQVLIVYFVNKLSHDYTLRLVQNLYQNHRPSSKLPCFRVIKFSVNREVEYF